MVAGERVRLKESVAKTFNKHSRGAQKRDWTKRRGELVWVRRSRAAVRWDGRKSLDFWPPEALRPA
jgi:hypothetical protein